MPCSAHPPHLERQNLSSRGGAGVEEGGGKVGRGKRPRVWPEGQTVKIDTAPSQSYSQE